MRNREALKVAGKEPHSHDRPDPYRRREADRRLENKRWRPHYGGKYRLDASHRFPRYVHAGRFRARGDWAVSEEECSSHDGDELLGLRDRNPRLLGNGVRFP